MPITAVDSRGHDAVGRTGSATAGRSRCRSSSGMRDEVAELVEIKSGLAAGDTVLLGSAQGVSAGAAGSGSLQEEEQR